MVSIEIKLQGVRIDVSPDKTSAAECAIRTLKDATGNKIRDVQWERVVSSTRSLNNPH